MSLLETRGIKRDSLFLTADVRLYGTAASERVKVRNLSDEGIMVEGELFAEEGQRVIVTLRNIGEVGGVVAWTQSARVGIAFDESIDSARVRQNFVETQKEAPRYARPAMGASKDRSFQTRKV